jgi:hypothetical protein
MLKPVCEPSDAQLKLVAARGRAKACKVSGDLKGRQDAVDDALWFRRLDMLDRISAATYIDPKTCLPPPRPCT